MVIELGHRQCVQGILPINIPATMEMILNIRPSPTVLKDVPYSDHL